MSREAHVRFDGSGEGQFLPATLLKFLCEAGDRPVEMTFDEIERLVGPLPASAQRHQAWWSNEVDDGTRHVQSKAWINAGREVEAVDRSARRVRFGAPGWRRGA